MQRRGEGDLGEAQDAFQRGVQFAERAVAAKPQSPEAMSNLVRVLCSLGDYFAQRGLTGDLNFPPEYYQRAASAAETWLAKNADTGTVREALATALGKAGDFLVKRGAVGDAEDALALYERALEVQKKALELLPNSRSNVLSVARTHRRLAEVAETLGRADQANANWRDCHRRLGEFVKAGGRPDGDDAALLKRLDERFNQSAKTGK
jgi:tetratricopeptide (TPR) repeat protein